MTEFEEISKDLDEMYQSWVREGREDDWHRIASQFVLPQQIKEMQHHFRLIIPLPREDKQPDSLIGKD